MKKILSIIAFSLISFVGFSQTKGISYQAVIIDPNPIQIPGSDVTAQPYVSKEVWIRFGIYSGTTLQYEELHKTKTDEYGLVNLLIGAGVNTGRAGTFTSLSWDGVTKNILTNVSFDQGGRYAEVSNQKLTYVPYTLLAETAVKLAGVLPIASGGTGATNAIAARTNLGLGNVDNTADADKPVSTATLAILDVKESLANKSINIIADSASSVKYPSVKAIKEYIDSRNSISAQQANLAAKATALATPRTINGIPFDGTANITIPVGVTPPDANATTKGLVQLAGDLSGTAAAPTIAAAAVSTAKIADGAVTDVKITSMAGSKVTGNIAGNAATATKLASPKNINGVPFDGSSDITISASAATLSGTVAIANGGSGASTAADARTNLGLAIGTDVLAQRTFGTAANSAATDFVAVTEKGATNGVATLGVNGKIPSVQIPALSFQNVTIVNSDATMIAISGAQVGSIAIRTDNNTNYVLSALPASVLNNWIQLAASNDVSLINGIVGPSVNLTTNEIPEGNANKYYTDARVRAALSATGPLALNASTGVISMTTASVSSDGYLSSADFTTFNNKQTALTAGVDYATPAGNITGNAANVTGIVAIANGGTGASTAGAALTNLGAEPSANKSNDILVDGSSTTKFPTFKAIKDYVDQQSANAGVADNSITSAKINGNLAVLKGGTGASTADGARTNLGLAIGTDVMAANFTTTLAGDVTGSGNGSFATTLANSGVTSGTYGSSTAIPTITVDAKGRVISANTVGIIAGVNSLNYTSVASYAAGGTISGTSLTLAAADGTNPGLLSTGAQTIAGAKTFSNNVTAPTFIGNVTGSVTGDVTGNAATATLAGNISATTNTSLTSLANLATVGTITSGTWSASTIDVAHGGTGSTSKNFVDLTTNQTIAGLKTFSSDASINGLTLGKGASNKIQNTAVGYTALRSNTTGEGNTAIGFQGQMSGTSGFANTSLGFAALIDNTTSSGNTAIGYQALQKNTGDNNIAIGTNTMYLALNSTRNIVVGSNALETSANGAANNIIMGVNSMRVATSASENVAIGNEAGSMFTTETRNTLIGANTNISAGITNSSALGYGATVNASNKIQLGNANVTSVVTSGTISATGFNGPLTGNAATATLAGNISATTNTSLTSLSSLATVGTITSGVWSATTIAIAKGGTGATTAAGALTNLGAEPTVNKSTATDLGSTSPSDVLFPSQKAVKAYVDAASGVSSGTYGSSTAIPTLTIDSKGRITSASTVGIIAGVNSLNYTSTTSYTAGGTISGTSLTLAAADGTNPGLVSTGVQTIAGAKTFSTDITAPNFLGNATTATTAGNITATSNTTLTSLTSLSTVGTITVGTWSGTVIGSNVGGAGSVSGLLKANGSGVVSAAVAGTDYQAPLTAGTSFIAPNAAVTAATKTKITYDAFGLVTAGADATTADIESSTDKRYVTDIQSGVLSTTSGTNTGDETASTIKTKLGIATLSGSNTGDQTITLTGDVTGTGTGTITSTIGDSKVTNTMLAGSITASKLVGTDIATVGTITSGTWSATTIDIAKGGTGATNAAAARTNLGLGSLATNSSIANADVASNAAIAFSKLNITKADITGLGVQDGLTAGSGISISSGSILVTGLSSSNLSPTAGITVGQLATSTTTLGSTIMTLGGTVTSVTGLTSISSTEFTGALTGNASTATKLAAAKNINGVAFDGSADITIDANSNTLTGTTLASNVVTSSLTTVGMITSGVWSGTAIAIANGGTGSTTKNFVDLTTDQTIAGAKTFSSNISVRGVKIGIGQGDNTTNTVLGGAALGSNTSGTYNTAIGGSALFKNITGSHNIAAGQGALENSVNGTNNAAMGSNALFNNTSGSGNAGFGIGGLYTNTTGDNNTSIGYGADVASGGLTNATAIGYAAIVGASNRIQLGNSSVTSVVTSGTISATGFTGPLTGNASTATKLAATKTINGTAFDGSADITIIADAGTLSGTTLKSTVTGSSLTSVGTITSGTWSATTIAVANGGTGVTTSTGSGNLVLSTSPTLVTPFLGIPTSVTLTNGTGLPISTGVSGLGTGVASFLATPTSANLIAAVTDETGTGSLVFANTPTLVTPVIGVATGTSLSLTGNLSAATGTYSSTLSAGATTVASLVSPSITGGSGTTQTLTYKTTSGVGATGADHIFQVGNNGAIEALRITNAGNVGVGTSTPSTKFEVNNGTSTNVTGINLTGSVDDFLQMNVQNTNNTGTKAQSGYAATADNGTTTTGFAWMGINNSAFNFPALYNIGAANDVTYIGSGQDMHIANANLIKSIIFSTGKNSTPFFNERMRITNAGNVGIGTATPSATLEVSGTTRLSGATTIAGAATFTSTVAITTGPASGKVLTSDASGNATWQNTGGSIATMSATGNATTTASYIIFTGSTSGQTITIPSAVTLGAGRELTIKNVASVPVSIASAGGNLIQDNSTLFATSAALGIEPSNNWMKLVSDGAHWYIFRALF